QWPGPGPPCCSERERYTMAMVQKNYSHAFYLNIPGPDSTFRRVDFRRGLNVVDDSVFETPEYKNYGKALELPEDASLLVGSDPKQGSSGGVGVPRSAAELQQDIREQNAQRVAQADEARSADSRVKKK